MSKETGAAPIILLLLIVAAVAVFYILVSRGMIRTSLPVGPAQPASIKTTVPLKTEYQNPFDKDAQYVNPFSSYKNPFDQLK